MRTILCSELPDRENYIDHSWINIKRLLLATPLRPIIAAIRKCTQRHKTARLPVLSPFLLGVLCLSSQWRDPYSQCIVPYRSRWTVLVAVPMSSDAVMACDWRRDSRRTSAFTVILRLVFVFIARIWWRRNTFSWCPEYPVPVIYAKSSTLASERWLQLKHAWMI